MSTNAKDLPIVRLESSRFENSRPLLIAGLAGRYSAETLDDLPALWKRFAVTSAESPDKSAARHAPTCSAGPVASIICRVWRSPNLRSFPNSSATCRFRHSRYFLTANTCRESATQSMQSGLSGYRKI